MAVNAKVNTSNNYIKKNDQKMTNKFYLSQSKKYQCGLITSYLPGAGNNCLILTQ